MASYFQKRKRHTKYLTHTLFKFREKHRMEWLFEIGKAILISGMAFFIMEKGFAVGQINACWLSVLAYPGLYVIFWTIHFLTTPKIFDKRLRKINREKEKIIQQYECKRQLIKDLQQALMEYQDAGKIDNGYEWDKKETKWKEILEKFADYKRFLTRQKMDRHYRFHCSFEDNYNRLCSLIDFLETGINIHKQIMYPED